jgi:hypothetical protein
MAGRYAFTLASVEPVGTSKRNRFDLALAGEQDAVRLADNLEHLFAAHVVAIDRITRYSSQVPSGSFLKKVARRHAGERHPVGTRINVTAWLTDAEGGLCRLQVRHVRARVTPEELVLLFRGGGLPDGRMVALSEPPKVPETGRDVTQVVVRVAPARPVR